MMNNTLYLDFQATTPTDPQVVETILPYYSDVYGNPLASNPFAKRLKRDIENSREIIAKAINCRPIEIVFNSGATEGINTALKGIIGWGNHGHIITVKSEHSAVLNTCRYLEKKGIDITYLNVNRDGIISLKELEHAIRKDTKLVSIMHANNEIGVIQPICDIGQICENHNIPFFTDAAQSFGKVPIDVKEAKISMLAISGHKIYGPDGIGVMYVKRDSRNRIEPLLHGGGHEGGLRSGTLNIPGIIGIGKAAELAISNMNIEQKRILLLRNLLLEKLQVSIVGLKVNGSLEYRLAGNLNVCFENVSGDLIINKLKDIVLSRGAACNSIKNQGSHVLKSIGLSKDMAESAIRISIGRFTTKNEILKAANMISDTINQIKEISTLD